jgi:hypothetical protein
MPPAFAAGRAHLLLGTHSTDHEPNFLLLASVTPPPPMGDANDDAMVMDVSTSAPAERGMAAKARAPTSVTVTQKIYVESEINRARAMPQNGNIVAVHTGGADLMVFDLTKHPSKPLRDGVQIPDVCWTCQLSLVTCCCLFTEISWFIFYFSGAYAFGCLTPTLRSAQTFFLSNVTCYKFICCCCFGFPPRCNCGGTRNKATACPGRSSNRACSRRAPTTNPCVCLTCKPPTAATVAGCRRRWIPSSPSWGTRTLSKTWLFPRTRHTASRRARTMAPFGCGTRGRQVCTWFFFFFFFFFNFSFC